MQEVSNTTIVDLIKRIPLDQVPSAIALLATRLLTEYDAARQAHGSFPEEPNTLLTAGELADRLHLPETWVRNEERLGRIPSVRAGRYVRFKQGEVEKALAERKRLGL